MSDSDSRRRDVAGLFSQTVRNAVFGATHRLYPAEQAPDITELTERIVESTGWQAEDVEVILLWLRSDKDAEWLEDFCLSEEGRRLLALNAELTMRSFNRMLKVLAEAGADLPHVSLRPPEPFD